MSYTIITNYQIKGDKYRIQGYSNNVRPKVKNRDEQRRPVEELLYYVATGSLQTRSTTNEKLVKLNYLVHEIKKEYPDIYDENKPYKNEYTEKYKAYNKIFLEKLQKKNTKQYKVYLGGLRVTAIGKSKVYRAFEESFVLEGKSTFPYYVAKSIIDRRSHKYEGQMIEA